MQPTVLLGHHSALRRPLNADSEHTDSANSHVEEKTSKAGPILGFGQDLLTLGKHPVYVLTVLGSTLYTGRRSDKLLVLALLATSSSLWQSLK